MNLSHIIHESKELSRVTEVSINRKMLVTPTYFPAVSSYGVKYSFHALVSLLIAYSYPRLLLSTYDLHFLKDEEKKRLLQDISEYWKKGCFVFLDSGVYESSWKVNLDWTYDLYKASISQVDFDFYSNFDVLPYPKNKSEKFVDKTFQSILASYSLSNGLGFVPILHGLNPDQLVSVVAKFVKIHPHLCDIIAVAERDCGKGLVEKARTVIKIRRLLNDSNRRRILHILGCGNPISLILFSYYGADMFDSLDWIKCVIDRDRLAINDFSHLDLIDCDCSICSGVKRDYTEKALLHNLLFYQDYMLQIQVLIRRNEIFEFIVEHIGKDLLKRIERSRT